MDTKTDAKAEAMMDPMTDMCPMEPRALFEAVAMHECSEAAMYNMLAQCAPTPCLQRMICMMAAEEANETAMLAAIQAAYGLGAAMPIVPGDPPPTMNPPMMPPFFYNAGEKKENK